MRIGRLVIVGALSAVSFALAAGTLPRVLGQQTLLVRTGSMGAAVPQGSLVVAKWIPAEQVEAGTIALLGRADRGSMPVLHRVIDRRVEGAEVVVRTKGDANGAADPGEQRLSGRVLTPVRVLPNVGYLVALTMTRAGWCLLVLLPATLLLARFLVRVWSEPVGRRPGAAAALAA